MSSPISLRNRVLFPVITAVVVPLLILALLELLLRLVGFGASQPLFVDAKGMPGYLQANLAVIERYFPAGSAPKVSIDTIYFRQQKEPGTLRVVVQGGSSAAGYPYGRWAGLAGMLQDRLENDLNERPIEVITTAMSAVNSYTLLDFADEITAIEPDAVLIYAGHNEFVGVMGVGSALAGDNSRGAKLLMLKLRHLRLYQAWQRLLAPVTVAPQEGARGTLMARAAAQQKIPYQSDIYQQGLAQFEGNMDLLLAHYARAGIPVLISTLASNEHDQPPFVGEPQIADKQWQPLWNDYRGALEAGDWAQGRAALEALLALDDAANIWYALGQLEWQAGAHDAARTAFVAARDRDQLRFRASAEVNQLIRTLATAHQATLVDGEAALRGACPHNIIDNSVMLEHLHPNGWGYFLLADAFYQALQQHPQLGGWQQLITRDQAWQEKPLTAVDDIIADYKIRVLKADYPFTKVKRDIPFPTPTNVVEQIAAQYQMGKLDWFKSQQSLLGHYRSSGDSLNALRSARLLAQAFPSQFGPNFATGALLLSRQDGRRAVRYLERALTSDPRNPEAWKALIFAHAQQGNKQLAIAALERAADYLAPAERQQLQQRLASMP
ncbi:MAG: tetratricopeptide repeat protein [Gammaproteobacteria bacterium]|nr:tetratricopeptide repeat protein [Gammaproteobacteria bacterium]